MVTRLHLFMITLVSLLLTSVVLIMYTHHRETEFLDRQREIQQAMVEGASRYISYRVSEQIRHVHLFNDEYRELLAHLARFPNDERTKEIIDIRLRERFPYVDSFTITDARGNPVLDDIEGNIGDICQRDITSFVTEVKRVKNTKKVTNQIFIHPQAGRYHYDVMAVIKDDPSHARSIFFVSFKPDPIRDILKSKLIPGHQLMLTRLHDSSLIEISDAGTRDSMGREGRLTKEELLSIKISKRIPNTDWVLVDLKDPKYEDAYIQKLWKESSGILLIVALANIMIFFVLSARIKYSEIRENKRDNKAFKWISRKA